MSANGTDPDDGDRSYRWCLEEGVRNDPAGAVDQLVHYERQVAALRGEAHAVKVERDEQLVHYERQGVRLRAEMAELVGQRDLARALHEVMDGVFPPVCRTCRDADENPTAWPCSTADQLGAHAATPYVSPWGVTS